MACRAQLGVLVAAAALVGCGGGQRDSAGEPENRRVGAPSLAIAAAPELVKRQCRKVAHEQRITARCPSWIPAAGTGERVADLVIEGRGDFEAGRCAWLTGYQYPRPHGRNPGAVFHLLVGGRCQPFPLTTRGRRWPASVNDIEPSLRLVGNGSLSAGDPPGTPFPRVRPQVIARTTVRDAPALVLAFGPYPGSGTVHGGHEAIVFNRGGDGQTVSMHFTRGSQSQRIELLRRVAASLRLPRDRP